MFDKTEEFTNDVERAARLLLLACNKAQIPVFISMAIADDGKETTYKNFSLTSARLGVKLTDDKIYRHVNVMNGFVTVPPVYAAGSEAYNLNDEDLIK